MYVGITRAKRHLTITLTKTRSKYGTRAESHPSRFLYEMKGEKPPKDWKAAGSSAPAVRVAEGGQRTRKKKSSKRSATAADLREKAVPRLREIQAILDRFPRTLPLGAAA